MSPSLNDGKIVDVVSSNTRNGYSWSNLNTVQHELPISKLDISSGTSVFSFPSSHPLNETYDTNQLILGGIKQQRATSFP